VHCKKAEDVRTRLAVLSARIDIQIENIPDLGWGGQINICFNH
jgi:hypothetical protein